ncbi:MAG: glycosyltransferase family 4 protein [bacterium]|nr:glycosyltransferase family 4 protein [bacterium]
MKPRNPTLNNSDRRVFILLQSDYPDDPRLSREIGALRMAGWRPVLLCNNRAGRPLREETGELTVYRVPSPFRFSPPLNKWLTSPFLLNPFWIGTVFRVLKRERIDAVHVVNLPLASLGILTGRILRKPVVYDMFENYPEAIRSWNLRGFRSILRNPRIAEIMDGFCMRKADRIITVVQEAADRLTSKGIAPERVAVVENTVDLTRFRSFQVDHSILRRYAHKTALIYTGQFSRERGLETAIDAMPLLKKRIPNAVLVLVGSGPHKNFLENAAKLRKLNDIIEFTGWVDYGLFPSYIRAASVCIIPQPSNPFIDTTMPNKMYEYMAMGKPVLASDAKPFRRLIAECRCGETFRSGSPEDFADQVVRILKSKVPYGKNGRRAVEKKYNWAVSSKELIRLYERL